MPDRKLIRGRGRRRVETRGLDREGAWELMQSDETARTLWDAGMALELGKIVSGGQTGVDRAGLEVAIWLGLEHGGWCPRGRRAEDGRIPDRYVLQETEQTDYSVRTERNVVESDGTLILYETRIRGGTALTVHLATRYARPIFLVDLMCSPDAGGFHDWMLQNHIEVLNVAGPRESSRPGIGQRARQWMIDALRDVAMDREDGTLPDDEIL